MSYKYRMPRILPNISDDRFHSGLSKTKDALIPAFKEFPIIKVVHPAYQALPNGGHPSFFPSGSRRLSCDLVLATEQNGSGLKVSEFENNLLTYILLDM